MEAIVPVFDVLAELDSNGDPEQLEWLSDESFTEREKQTKRK